MRIRYERRDPRAEDLREIDELKSVIDAQDKDLRKLTEQLREMQMNQQFDGDKQMGYGNQSSGSQSPRKPKKSKINCDVIYEENEEQEPSTTFMHDTECAVEQ